MKYVKTFESFNPINEGLSHDDAYKMLDIAAQYTSGAHAAASQMWSDAQDLYDYIASDHITSKKDKKAFYKSVKREFPEVNEGFIEISQNINKPIAKKMLFEKNESYVVIDPRGNASPIGSKIQGQRHVKGKKGHYIVLSKNALKARRAIEKAGGKATSKKIQDIMYDLMYESKLNEISVEKGLEKVNYDNPTLDGIKITGVLAWDIQMWMLQQPDAKKLNKGRFRDLVPILHSRGFADRINGANLRNWQAVVKKHIK
tara:strand:+ start:1112 stop:1885 length:774 start_codon:yes stop_codon:yes gene_type:complete